MKKNFLIAVIAVLVFVGIFVYNYLENKDDPETVLTSGKNEVTPESAYYSRTEEALHQWEKAAGKSKIEKTLSEIQEKNIGKLRSENPFLVNMIEGVDSSKLDLPKEIESGKKNKILKSTDSFIYAGKKYYAAYYTGGKEKDLRFYREESKGLVEIELEGMLPAPLYGFKTIQFSKNDTPVLVAMMFLGDDSGSTRNYYVMNAEGKFKKIYSFDGAWVEERYADLDGDGVLEIILQRRLNWEPPEVKEILNELKEKKLSGYNAIFYEHEIVNWDPKNRKMAKAGAIIKADFSHKE